MQRMPLCCSTYGWWTRNRGPTDSTIAFGMDSVIGRRRVAIPPARRATGTVVIVSMSAVVLAAAEVPRQFTGHWPRLRVANACVESGVAPPTPDAIPDAGRVVPGVDVHRVPHHFTNQREIACATEVALRRGWVIIGLVHHPMIAPLERSWCRSTRCARRSS